jgi:hypothetical protein
MMHYTNYRKSKYYVVLGNNIHGLKGGNNKHVGEISSRRNVDKIG